MNDRRNRPSIVIGVVLILLGLFFLFSQLVNLVFHIQIGSYTWPLLILAPGLLLYFLAFFNDVKTGRVLVVPGSIVSAVGLLLFFQNITNLWATWAYAWAFVFPTSLGIGQIIFGWLRRRADLVREGWGFARVGGIILLVGFTFFELLIGISDLGFFGLRGFCFPLVLMAGGLLFILFNLRPSRKPASTPVETVSAQPQQTTVETNFDSSIGGENGKR
jgi:hypothetical protein